MGGVLPPLPPFCSCSCLRTSPASSARSVSSPSLVALSSANVAPAASLFLLLVLILAISIFSDYRKLGSPGRFGPSSRPGSCSSGLPGGLVLVSAPSFLVLGCGSLGGGSLPSPILSLLCRPGLQVREERPLWITGVIIVLMCSTTFECRASPFLPFDKQ